MHAREKRRLSKQCVRKGTFMTAVDSVWPLEVWRQMAQQLFVREFTVANSHITWTSGLADANPGKLSIKPYGPGVTA